MDISQAAAALSSLQALVELGKAASNVRDQGAFLAQSNELQAQIAGLLGEIVAGHQKNSSLQVEIESLKRKLSDLEDWEKEKLRYELIDFGGETFAYRLKADAANGEPPHRLCPDCFQ